MILRITFALLFITSTLSTLAQRDSLQLKFVEVSHRPYQIDALQHSKWKTYYDQVIFDHRLQSVSSTLVSRNDTIRCVFPRKKQRSLVFQNGDTVLDVKLIQLSKDTFDLVLPNLGNYLLDVYYKGDRCGILKVVSLPRVTKKVILVPMTIIDLDLDSLSSYLNSVYSQAGILFEVEKAPFFNPDELKIELFSNPSDERNKYTEEMISVRNAYFDRHKENGEYYLFLIDGFVNESINGFMVRNNGFGFIKTETENLYRTIARELAFGAGALEDSWENDGPRKGSTDNLMDIGTGVRLNYWQWVLLQENVSTVKYYDEYEQVRTNSGLVAFYTWEEDENGNIITNGQQVDKVVRHPMKRNLFSYHLNIDNWLFIPLFPILQYQINSLHLISVILCLIFFRFGRIRLNEWLLSRFKLYRPLRWAIRITSLILFLISCYGSFLLINRGYLMFEVNEGSVDEYIGMTIEQVERNLRQNLNLIHKDESPASELMIKRGEEWIMRKEKLVLYFEVKKNKDGEYDQIKFLKSSDILEVHFQNHTYRKKAKNHYYVLRFLNEDGSIEYDRLFNHWGNDLNNKIVLPDPAQRILLLVNGYRPTSIGNTFEENFEDITHNGLEFPNSNNMIFNFDRYDYWNRWNEMDTRFKQRINPAEIYYADGHFSVSTSNHGSLIHFSRLANNYPKRCENGNHVCQTSKVNDWELFSWGREVRTAKLLSTESNKEGFNVRRENGRIAGKNFLMMLNELPNKSANDTIYIVAHSMGYAYSLGMVDELRGHINFGGLYIIAPENAAAGKVQMDEWKEIWQFGSNHDLHQWNEPCLLDGIAVQKKVGGLDEEQRVFIPEKYYNRMGFYDSHFIGYYTWIFDVPHGEKGHINQR